QSALVLTGRPVFSDFHQTEEAPTTLEGGGLIDLPLANNPLVFAAPTNVAFGLLPVGTSATRSIDLTDAGGGSGDWTVSLDQQTQTPGVALTATATVTVPGRIDLSAAVAPDAAEVDLTGFVVLQRGADTRRIPYWL